MPSVPRSPYPPAAVGWLVGDRPARVLDLGSGKGGFAQMLVDAGHEIFCVDRSPKAAAELNGRVGTFRPVAARVEALPFFSCHFDVVTASQSLHHFAPGLALTEIARVLKPGGRIAIAYNTRDDTVPWVKRLMAMTRSADPEAMTGDYGLHAVDTVSDSPYFAALERRNFRNWAGASSHWRNAQRPYIRSSAVNLHRPPFLKSIWTSAPPEVRTDMNWLKWGSCPTSRMF